MDYTKDRLEKCIIEDITKVIETMGAAAFARLLMDAADGVNRIIEIPKKQRVDVGLRADKTHRAECTMIHNGRAMTFRITDSGCVSYGKTFDVEMDATSAAEIAAEMILVGTAVDVYPDSEGRVSCISYERSGAFKVLFMRWAQWYQPNLAKLAS
jgi:hypothetical protein